MLVAVSAYKQRPIHCQFTDTESWTTRGLKGRNFSIHIWAQLCTVLSWSSTIVRVTAMQRINKQIILFCVSTQDIIMACHISFGKIYFAWFLLQFACTLLAFHSISHVAGMRSKVRTYIATNNRYYSCFSVKIWSCSHWSETLMLDSNGSNAELTALMYFVNLSKKK